MKTTPHQSPDAGSKASATATPSPDAASVALPPTTPTRATIPAPLVVEAGDFYLENGRMVFTATFHLRRGYCCCSRCRHCPYRDWSR